MAEHFDNPPSLSSDDRRNMEMLYQYLTRVSDQLNQSLITIGTEATLTEEAKRAAQAAGQAESAETEDGKTYNALRSMIIKSAKIVRSEMDELRTTLQSDYVAQSEFGTYQQAVTNAITASADGIRQDFTTYTQTITNDMGDYNEYIRKNSQYIFIGIVDKLNNKAGIAIGDGVTGYDEHGDPVLADDRKSVTLTAEELGFWEQSTKVAWISGRKLYITECEVLNRLRIGNFVWRIMENASLALLAN